MMGKSAYRTGLAESCQYFRVQEGGGVAEAARIRECNTGDNTGTCQGEWTRVLSQLKAEIGDDAFRNWLRPMNLQHVDSGQAVIAAPTRFLRDWVTTHYADRILALWRAENERMTRLSIVVGASPRYVNGNHPPGFDDLEDPAPAAPLTDLAPPLEIGDDRAQLLALDHRFVFENFVVGKPNELAHAAARRVAEACASPVHTVPFNPLFLYGGVGLGKTHLMHAIAWHVRKHAGHRKIIYLSAEKFMYQFIRALRFKSTMDF
jgi:chromosomal replication initiator protein